MQPDLLARERRRSRQRRLRLLLLRTHRDDGIPAAAGDDGQPSAVRGQPETRGKGRA